MQSNILKALSNKKQKQPATTNSNAETTINQPAPSENKQQPKSKLLSMLQSQIVTGSASNTTKPTAPQPTTTTVKPKQQKSSSVPAKRKEKASPRHHQVIETKPCPLCGEEIPLLGFDTHLKKELVAYQVDDDDDFPTTTSGAAPSTIPTSTTYTIPAAKVVVIGGKPQQRIPKDPKRLKTLLEKQPLKKSRPTVQESYNHYTDGPGWVDAEDVGVDIAGGIAWEGVGTSAL